MKFSKVHKKCIPWRRGIIFFGVLVVAGGLSVLIIQKANLVARYTNLAALIGIDIHSLKQWRDRGGLKRDLAWGDQGTDVTLLQKALTKVTPGSLPAKYQRGWYDSTTAQAVRQFQKQFGLPMTGAVGPRTREKLNELYVRDLCPHPDDKPPDLLLADITLLSGVPKDYVPDNLIDVSPRMRTVGVVCLREDVAEKLAALFADAQKSGIIYAATSGFRRFEMQDLVYRQWIASGEDDSEFGEVAPPGYSEHQLGTTVDLTGASINFRPIDVRLGDSVEGEWLAAHAWEYGFIESYGKGREKKTGYRYEPWHWRYVGVGVARNLREEGKTLHEYFSQPY